MATQTGVKVNFGFTGTDGIAATGLTMASNKGMLFQGADYSKTDDEVQLKSAAGALATRIFPNPGEKATLDFIPASDSTVAKAIEAQTAQIALYHTILNITACDSKPELVKTNWFVVGVSSKGSNTDVSKITLELEAHAGITAAAA